MIILRGILFPEIDLILLNPKDRPRHVPMKRVRVRHVTVNLRSHVSEPCRVTCLLRGSTWIWADLAWSESCRMIMEGDAMFLRNGAIGVSKIIRTHIINSCRENFTVMFNRIEMVDEKLIVFREKQAIWVSCLPCAADRQKPCQNPVNTHPARLGKSR